MKHIEPVSLSSTNKETQATTKYKKTKKIEYAKAHAKVLDSLDYSQKRIKALNERVERYYNLTQKAEKISTRRAVYTLIAAVVAVIAYGHGVWF